MGRGACASVCGTVEMVNLLDGDGRGLSWNPNLGQINEMVDGARPRADYRAAAIGRRR